LSFLYSILRYVYVFQLRSTGIQAMLNVVGDKLIPAASDSEHDCWEAEAISSGSEDEEAPGQEARWALLWII